MAKVAKHLVKSGHTEREPLLKMYIFILAKV